MGLNAYLEAVGGVGKTVAATTALGAVVKIDGKPGKRLAITALGFSDLTGVVVPVGYFMKSIMETTVSTAVASNATTIACTAFAETPATSANVVMVLDNGTYQWSTIATTSTTASLHVSNLTDTMAVGNKIYYLGTYASTGHYVVNGTTAAQKALSLELGIFYGTTKGSPMMVTVIDAGSTALCQIDYVTYGYLNI